MGIADIDSGYKMLELACRKEKVHDDKKIVIKKLWEATSQLRYLSEHVRALVDELTREPQTQPRFFNFDDDGEVTEVDQEHFNSEYNPNADESESEAYYDSTEE